MRSKNQVPVQVILPQTQMSSTHSTHRGGFEEALQSSIEASLRSNGNAPSLRIFSSLYHQSKPHSNDERIGQVSLPDNGDIGLDVKPDISNLNRELNRQYHSSEDQESVNDQSRSAPPEQSTSSPTESGAHSKATVRGPPPLLLPPSYLRPPVTSNNNDTSPQNNAGNMQLMQRLPSLLPGNIQQIEQFKKAQEQVKQLQQLQKLHLLQQHQARAAVASSLSQMPRLPFFNPMMPPSTFNRHNFAKSNSTINGVQDNVQSTNQTSPGSPMFRKGYCKGGKDIRLSTLQQDGSHIVPYPADFTLVALSISPSVQQIVKPTGGYHPADVPAEAMVVAAISSKCLPPHQFDPAGPIIAQCVGCGDATLVNFGTLSSHINLRSAVSVGALQRHARNFVLRDANPPHCCARGAIIPWPSIDIAPPREIPLGRLPMIQSSGGSTYSSPAVLPSNVPRPAINEQLRETCIAPQTPKSAVLPPDGVSISHQDIVKSSENKIQTSYLNSKDSEKSPLQALPKPDFGNINQDWSSAVKLPESFPEFVGLPLILICWEWQQLQSNIHNIHITRSFTKCFQDAMATGINGVRTGLSKEMCYFVLTQYLTALGDQEFPIASALSSWLSRAQLFVNPTTQHLVGGGVVSLVQVTIANSPEKIGLVISQKSQAHAINECIAKLQPDGPTCHIIAHVNRNLILDLSVLLTGHTSRLTREFLLNDEMKFHEVMRQMSTPEVFEQIDLKLKVPLLGSVLSSLSLESRNALTNMSYLRPLNSVKHGHQSTSDESDASGHNFSLKDSIELGFSTSGFNQKIATVSDQSTSSSEIAHILVSKVSEICSENNSLALSQFSSIHCYFILPPSQVAKNETMSCLNSSNLLRELGSTLPSQENVNIEDIVIKTALKSERRFHSLCELIKEEASTLFILFFTDAHIHCDTNSLGSEWISTLMQYHNTLVIFCTHIPHPFLNQNNPIPHENIILCENESRTVDHLTVKLSPQSITYDRFNESIFLKMSASLPTIHSILIKAQVLSLDYISSIGLFFKLSCLRDSKASEKKEILRTSSSPLTYCIVRDLFMSMRGSTVLIRIPTECVAEKFTDNLMNAREAMKLQNAFEIILYATHDKLRLSPYFLKLLQASKHKPDDWTPKTLSDIDCIPLILIYTGKHVLNHELPSNVSCVDLRLVGTSSGSLTQSSIISEISLVKYNSSVVSEQTTNHSDQYQPKEKKMKSDSDDDALCMDIFSDDSSERNDRLQWKSFDQDPLQGQSPKTELSSIDSSQRKRKRVSSTGDLSNIVIKKHVPTVIVSRELHSFVMSYVNETQKFRDLTPHPYCEWSQSRTVINGKFDQQMAVKYLRKWSTPLSYHRDYDCMDRKSNVNQNSRTVLLVTAPQSETVRGCCTFVKQLHRCLMELLQVEAHDYLPSSKIKPCYPLLSSNISPKWPVYTTILEMEFDASVQNAAGSRASQITNRTDGAFRNTNSEGKITVSPCSIGKCPAFDANHKESKSNRNMDNLLDMAATHVLTVPNLRPNDNTSIGSDKELELSFVIPHSQERHFILKRSENSVSGVHALNLRHKDQIGIKTPVFSMSIEGPAKGLYNLSQTSQNSTTEDESSMDELLHVIVVKHKDCAEYRTTWPNKVLMVLPKNYDDLAAGAMKYAVQCVMHHSVSVRREQSNSFAEFSHASDIWPFALLLDDSVVLWTSASEKGDGSEGKWQNVSLASVLQTIESLPCVERYAAIGFRRWSSQMEIPKSEEDFSGDLVSSSFSKCHLTSCFAINTVSTKDETFDYTKFLHEDIDWCTRIAAVDMAILRFNGIAFANKVFNPSSCTEFNAISNENPEALVSLADSDYQPIMKHPHHILETFLCRLGHTVFPKAVGNERHPVLVVDCYVSLGVDVFVEFACSKPGALPWSTNFDKTYSGMLLYCQSSDIPLSFLQQFKFLSGANVCIVGRDRSSLRQTVVNLHLENDWHFRLTDEYQTANDASKRKPLFYLTGVSRVSR